MNNTLVFLLIFLTVFWIGLNLIYRFKKQFFQSKGFKLYYGVLLIYRRYGIVFKTIGFLKVLSFVFIAIFIYILFSFYLELVFNVIGRFYGGEASIRVLIPGVNIKGVNIVYFFASLTVATVIHELMHALIARAFNVNVKSVGFAVLPILALAFVEVDDKDFVNQSIKVKSAILSAGPVANFLLGLLALTVLTLSVDPYGLVVLEVYDGLAKKHGIETYDILVSVNDRNLTSTTLREVLSVKNDVNLTFGVISRGVYREIKVYKPAEVDKLNVYVINKPRDYLLKTFGLRGSIELLLFATWMWIVNVSLAFINTIPLFVNDGGRIIYEISRNKDISVAVSVVTLIVLTLALIPR